jgi:hypothetical protein
MMKTIREAAIGKFTMRLLEHDGGYVGAIIGGKTVQPIEGDDPEALWKRLRLEVGKAHPSYFGYDGARARFLRLFPDGFGGAEFARHERDPKVSASSFLNSVLPLEMACSPRPEHCELAMKAYTKIGMLSPFESARTRDVLKGADGVAFIAAAAALARGEVGSGLKTIERVFAPHGQPSWPAATFLPFFWRPDDCMFLKPEVTKDFAERVGHPFASVYGAKLEAPVYEALMSLALETKAQLKDLGPRDMIDIQSFIWIVGAYDEPALAERVGKA